MYKELEEMLKKSTFSISEEVYFYCKVDTYPKNLEDHFMITKDTDEISVVTKYPEKLENLSGKNENEWCMVDIHLHTPFMKGTLFTLSKAVFESDSNILIVSTLSKDILFVKKSEKEKAALAMRSTGIKGE